MLKEGRATFGVWGPLAAASVYEALLCIIRMFAENGRSMKLPTCGEILEGWALPFLAAAVREDEKSAKAQKMFEDLKRFKAKIEGKAEE